MSIRSSKKKKEGKKKPIWRVLNFFASFLLILTLGATSQILYEYNRYKSFYVSGDSMYPFFNKDATRTNLSSGLKEDYSSHDGDWGNYNDPRYKYTCDYGLLDEKDDFKEKIQRFDVVMAYFDSDYDVENGKFFDDDSHAAKIKRVYAFPFESLYFDSEGNFFLKKAGENDYKEVRQLDILYDDNHLKETTIGAKYATENNPLTLKEGEYFLIGDNRREGKSNDSRYEGPIGKMHSSDSRYPFGKDLIKGKIIAITGSATIEVKYDNDGKLITSSNVNLGTILFPWRYKEL